MYTTILSLWGWFIIITLTLFYTTLSFLLFLPLYPFSPKKCHELFHSVAVLWAKSIIGAFPFWSLKVSLPKYDWKREKVYLFIANHQSIVDILVALASIPIPFRFMAKKELFSIPFLGLHMRMAGYIPVDRAAPQSRRQALEQARLTLQQNISVLMFPEGTRSLDGNIQKFKPGAFGLAVSERVPVVACIFDGTGNAIPKKSWRLSESSKFKVLILEPEYFLAGLETADVMNKVRTQMMTHLEEARKL